MESTSITALAISAACTVGLAAVLGYLGQKRQWMGAVILGLGAAVASILCVAGSLVGYKLGAGKGGWIGLLSAVALAGMMGALVLGKLIRGRSGRFIAGLWFGYCGLCIFGYLAAGWLGLLTITLPSVAIFWIGLYRISAYILPLRDKSQRPQALRSLLTFTMGTNYPYYFVKNGKAEQRVEGNPYHQFFAGPGLVHTDCDHAAYITSGIQVRGVFDPGLNFTGMFDLAPKIIDLRPQLRRFYVEALTKDGIPIRVLTFVPFGIHPGTQKVGLGRPFPFRHRAVYDIVAREPVERKRKKDESGERHEWDVQLIPLVTTRIVQDIIGKYTVDDLCAPLDPDHDPRVEIVTEMKRKLGKALLPFGIELVGGGISNLLPLDETVLERRLDNWKTEWERRILLLMTEGKAERTKQIEEARAKAEEEIVLRFSQIVQERVLDSSASETALALRFIDCLGEIVSRSETQWPLPESAQETLKCLRGEIEEGPR